MDEQYNNIIMADKALIQGARELAASRGFVDYAGSFSKGFDSAGRKAKKEQKILEINNKVSEYYDTVDLDVDLSGFSPETKNIYEQQLIGYKEQVYQNATALANIDASDPKYLEYKSKLNSINSSVSNMAAQAELLQQLGSEYRTINTSGAAGLGGFSVGADPANVEDMRKIFLDKSVPLQVDETGNLHYNVNGKKYSVKDFKMPLLKASQQGKFIIDKNSSLSTLGRALTPANVDALKNQYKDLISSKGILSSLLSTDFTDIPTADMDIEDYDNWEDARDEFINRLAIANKSAAANSIKFDENNNAKTNGGQTMNTATVARMKEIQDHYNQSQAPYKYESDDLKFIFGSATNPISVVYNPKSKQLPWEVTLKTLDPQDGTLSAELIKFRNVEDLQNRSNIKF